MLRMIQAGSGDSPETIVLHGRLVGPWVDQLRQLCQAWPSTSPALRLDLSGVSYVDAAGVALLGQLRRQGAAITGLSRFIAEMLREDPQ